MSLRERFRLEEIEGEVLAKSRNFPKKEEVAIDLATVNVPTEEEASQEG